MRLVYRTYHTYQATMTAFNAKLVDMDKEKLVSILTEVMDDFERELTDQQRDYLNKNFPGRLPASTSVEIGFLKVWFRVIEC